MTPHRKPVRVTGLRCLTQPRGPVDDLGRKAFASGRFMQTLGFLLIFICGDVLAATCLSRWLQTAEDPLAKAIELSDAIFIGEVMARKKTLFKDKEYDDTILAVSSTFRVTEVLKGTVAYKVYLEASEPCDCKYDFEPGVEYVVLASIVDGRLVPSFCDYVAPMDSALLSDIRARLP